MEKQVFYIPFRTTRDRILRLPKDFCSLFSNIRVINGVAEIDEIGNIPVRIDTLERTIAGLDLLLRKAKKSESIINSIKIIIQNISPLQLKVSASKEPPKRIVNEGCKIECRPELGIYLGEELEYQYSEFIRTGKGITLKTDSLNTHVFICGVTGAGKTVLGKILLEEAALAGIPCIAIDLKGDISSLALVCAGHDDVEEYAQLLNIKKGDEIEKIIANVGSKQRNYLQKYGITTEDVSQFKNKVQVNIFTPRSNNGFRLAFSAFLKPPINFDVLKEHDPDAYESAIDFTTENFVQRLGLSINLKEKARGYVYEIIKKFWSDNISIEGAFGIKKILDEIREPQNGIEQIGGMPIDEYIEEKDRKFISIAINNLLIGAGKLWFIGMPFDLPLLTNKKEFNGLTPINIINLKHLNFKDQAFVVGQIAYMINFWMRELGEANNEKPRLIFYIDEIGGGGSKEAFFPSVAKPSCKPALNILLRQGRSFGVSCIFATQSPNDIDFKALANCRTWMVGQLRSNRERNNIKQGISNSDFMADATLEHISELDSGCFITTSPSFAELEKKWIIFRERWLMHLHRGLSDKDIQKIISKYEADALYRYNLAEEQIEMNKTEEAIKLLISLITGFRFSKNRPKGFLRLAQLYYEKERFNDTMNLLNKFLQESLDTSELTHAHFLLGKCYLKMQNLSKALQEFELANESNDDTDNKEKIIKYKEYTKSLTNWQELSTIGKVVRWIFDKKIRKKGQFIFDSKNDIIDIIPFKPQLKRRDLEIYEQIDYTILTQIIKENDQRTAEESVNQKKAQNYVIKRMPELSKLIYEKNEESFLKAKELSERLISRLVTNNAIAPDEFINLLNVLNEHLEHLDQKKMRKLLNLEARQFEYEVAQLFSNMGFDTIVTKQSRDDGVDVYAIKGNEKTMIQCKRYSKPVGRQVVNELLGTLTRNPNICNACLVTTSYFTDDAKKAARSGNIELWDSYRLRKQWQQIFLNNDET